jgi:transposase
MSQPSQPVGIDISKKTFDVQLGTDKKNKRLCRPFANQEAGFKDLLAWMQQEGYTDAHVCLEATDAYALAAPW